MLTTLVGVLAATLWSAWLEVQHVRGYLRETQAYARYAADLVVQRNNEIVWLRHRVQQLERRTAPVLPPVGDWEGVMK